MNKILLFVFIILFIISIVMFLILGNYYWNSIAYCRNTDWCAFAAAELSYLGTIPLYLLCLSFLSLFASYKLKEK